MKKMIISTDVGFNGVKCIVGEYLGDGEMKELFNFHTSSDVFETTHLKSIGSGGTNDEESVFVKEETESSKRTFVVGKAAKQYITTPDGRVAIKDDEFYNSKNDEFQRFLTPNFEKLHLAVLFKAVATLAQINGYDILDNPGNFRLKIEVQLPHIIHNNATIRNTISGYIKNANKCLEFRLFDEKNYIAMPEIVESAEIGFSSQVLAAVIGELADDPDANKKKPVVAIDCGGKTIGVATVEPSNNVANNATSNTEYAVNNINKSVCSELSKLSGGEYVPEPDQIEEIAKAEALAISEDPDACTTYWSRSEKKSVAIKVSEIYKKKCNETAKALAKFCFAEYCDDLGRAKTILVAGGTGVVYYDILCKEFSKALHAPIILAKGAIGDFVNGSIYAVAVGGFKLAAMEYLEEEEQ